MDKDKKEAAAAAVEANTNMVQSRISLDKITIETPALLNMIKHCQDKRGLSSSAQLEVLGARGSIMGVLKQELDESILLVTATLPE